MRPRRVADYSVIAACAQFPAAAVPATWACKQDASFIRTYPDWGYAVNDDGAIAVQGERRTAAVPERRTCLPLPELRFRSFEEAVPWPFHADHRKRRRNSMLQQSTVSLDDARRMIAAGEAK